VVAASIEMMAIGTMEGLSRLKFSSKNSINQVHMMGQIRIGHACSSGELVLSS